MALIIDPISDTTFYDSVRRLLGGVDEDVLPNEDISDPAILDMAEFKVLDLLPSYDPTTISFTDKAKVRLATIHIMGTLLCPSMPGRVDIEVKTIDLSWKRKAMDYDALLNRLMGTAIDLLDSLEGFDVGADAIVFAIAPSRRGRHAER